MASKTITLGEAAYQRLKKLKLPGESFTEVVLRELPERWETLGEMEDYFSKHGVPKANSNFREAMLRGRGRRSRGR